MSTGAMETYQMEEPRTIDEVRALEREDADHFVYVIEMSRKCDGWTFYYVGETANLMKRLRSHKRNGVGGPVPGGKLDYDHREGLDYYEPKAMEFEGVLVLRKMIQSGRETEKTFQKRVMNMERETMLEMAVQLESTRVLGGH